jgi:hypothetical protein
VHIRSLVERDLPALEVGDRLDRAVLRDQDCLAAGSGWLVRHVDERSACGLGENRRRLTGIAEIDRADIDRFQQLRAGRKFGPHRFEAERFELLVERALALEQDQLAVFLKADAHDLVLRLRWT